MKYQKRTHTCGELRSGDTGKTVTLTGWVDSVRDLGGVIFIIVRDRYGKTQAVFNPQIDKNLLDTAASLSSEDVISLSGKVARRPDGMVNPSMPTGEIDIIGENLTILSKSDVPPFSIVDDVNASEELRLQYRYLDLRRPSLQKNFELRHRIYQIARRYFDELKFLEIETPYLMKSTPEGARDFLVPSRRHKGKFYALPQSPQTYKQILMVAGMDRYFQIVKCFRDEDFRADRQPEFTQIDVEMSFADESDIMSITEGLMVRFFKELKGEEINAPFRRIAFKEAMETYGSDKPDTRFEIRLHSISDICVNTQFKIFSETVKKGGVVAGLTAPSCASFSRSQIDVLTDFVKNLGAGGLVWIRLSSGKIESPAEKFLGQDILKKLAERMGAHDGDLILIISDMWSKAYTALGALRLEIGRRLNLIDEKKDHLLWVTDFPMFEYDETEKRYVAVHHPFTSPNLDDIPLLDKDPSTARARAYDLVLNGNEIAGGSIRIHDRSLQILVFKLLGIDEREAKEKFGFLLDAFRYGAPPHGGIAFGVDRICMIMAGEKSIRDVIAFPKTTSAMSLMDNSPSTVDPVQLKDLHIKLTDE
jgi:aspartyl-tRNA synthetase